MLKNISRLEYKIEDRVFHLLCENDSPLEHVKEALFQFQKYVGHLEDSIKAQIEAKKLEEESSIVKEEKPEEPIQV